MEFSQTHRKKQEQKIKLKQKCSCLVLEVLKLFLCADIDSKNVLFF